MASTGDGTNTCEGSFALVMGKTVLAFAGDVTSGCAADVSVCFTDGKGDTVVIEICSTELFVFGTTVWKLAHELT